MSHLAKYGRHIEECRIRYAAPRFKRPMPDACTCGLDAALAHEVEAAARERACDPPPTVAEAIDLLVRTVKVYARTLHAGPVRDSAHDNAAGAREALESVFASFVAAAEAKAREEAIGEAAGVCADRRASLASIASDRWDEAGACCRAIRALAPKDLPKARPVPDEEQR